VENVLETRLVSRLEMYILSFVLLLWNVFLGYKLIKITWYPEPEPVFSDDEDDKDE
jgi:hypothetical protein